MSPVLKQARTHRVSTRTIVASREFARGLEEVRKGLPFNPDNGSWDYERGRCFGFSRRWTCRCGSTASSIRKRLRSRKRRSTESS